MFFSVEVSSRDDFLKLFMAAPKSEPILRSFFVPNKTTTIIKISNIDHGDIPLNILIPHFFLLFFSSIPEVPNLFVNSSSIVAYLMSSEANNTRT